MRKTWVALQWTGAIVLALAGCKSAPDKYKPAPRGEQFILPPETDHRFDQPIAYPKGTLNKDNSKKDSDSKDDDMAPPTLRSPTSRSGGSPGY
jgi:hypothetical protein